MVLLLGVVYMFQKWNDNRFRDLFSALLEERAQDVQNETFNVLPNVYFQDIFETDCYYEVQQEIVFFTIGFFSFLRRFQFVVQTGPETDAMVALLNMTLF